MAEIEPKWKVSVRIEIAKIVREEMKNAPHDFSTHKGLEDFRKDMVPKLASGFPAEKRAEVTRMVNEEITRHAEFHDINREKTEEKRKSSKTA